MAGRGRSRGRGRGGAMGGPTARDDEGNLLEAASPPKLFPDLQIPDRVGEDARIAELRAQQKRLNDFWRASVYKLGADSKADDVPAYAKVERWSDRQNGKHTAGTLQQALTLDPTYFPEELYSAKDKRISAKAASHKAQCAFWAASAARSGDAQEDRATARIMTLLDKHEAQDTADLPTSPSAKVKREDGEEEEEDEDEDEEGVDMDDEAEDVEDDYLQGEQVDDDDGYVDPYAHDDGGDQAYM